MGNLGTKEQATNTTPTILHDGSSQTQEEDWYINTVESVVNAFQGIYVYLICK